MNHFCKIIKEISIDINSRAMINSAKIVSVPCDLTVFPWTRGLSQELTGLKLEMTQPSRFEKETNKSASFAPCAQLPVFYGSPFVHHETDCRYCSSVSWSVPAVKYCTAAAWKYGKEKGNDDKYDT